MKRYELFDHTTGQTRWNDKEPVHREYELASLVVDHQEERVLKYRYGPAAGYQSLDLLRASCGDAYERIGGLPAPGPATDARTIRTAASVGGMPADVRDALVRMASRPDYPPAAPAATPTRIYYVDDGDSGGYLVDRQGRPDLSKAIRKAAAEYRAGVRATGPLDTGHDFYTDDMLAFVAKALSLEELPDDLSVTIVDVDGDY